MGAAEPAAPGGPDAPRATVVGTGLIGASIGLALSEAGWHVSGVDADPATLAEAEAMGAVHATGWDPLAEVTFVATPVAATAAEVERALAVTEDVGGLVTDVASVKGPLVELMGNPRYVGGHPMAGSEREGPAGASASMFVGATWVLTPVPGTDDDAVVRIRAVLASLGAEVVAVAPDRHDEMVAVVSHVPHLTAATLMSLAGGQAAEHQALLRLAGGGFRDMTRVASGHPAIWGDICAENRDAIVAGLDALIGELGAVRDVVADGDSPGLVARLAEARAARRNLPDRLAAAEDLVEVRLGIADEAGALARVLLLAAEVDVSVADVEIVHSTEGTGGTLVLVVEAEPAKRLVSALAARGFTASVVPLQ